MNNYSKMQQFLEEMAIFLKSNPPEVFNSHFIYSNLAIDSSKKATGNDIGEMFDIWCNNNHFSNINVFVDPKYPYFCQFISKNYNPSEKEIKLYIPLDEDHILAGAFDIFGFLDKKKINHQSKIAKRVRTDDLIVRTDSINSALDIIEYVRNNKYLRDGLIATNPFLINYNGVGVAIDGRYSYNEQLSKLIYSYLTEEYSKSKNFIPDISLFNKFVKEKYNLLTDNNLQTIYKIIGKTTGKNSTIRDIVDISNHNGEDKALEYKKSVLLNASLNNIEKYGAEQLKEALIYSDAFYNGFTRDGDARNQMKAWIEREKLYDIIKSCLSDYGIEVSKDMTKEELCAIYTKYINQSTRNVR